jgi:hypothetical protein
MDAITSVRVKGILAMVLAVDCDSLIMVNTVSGNWYKILRTLAFTAS